MKKYLLGAVAALAIAAPGVASAQSGYADLAFSNTDVGSSEIDTTQIGGAYVWGGDGTVGFQLDGVIGQHEYDGGGDVDTYNIGGHAFVRNANHLIGGFVNFGNTDFGFGEYDYYTLGAEGAIYMQRTTFSGTLSWSDSQDFDATITALDLGATHFFTDNFSFGGTAGFGEIEGGDEFTSFGLGGEYLFTAVPVSLFGGWTTTDYDGFETDALTLGVRYNFGGTSLLERDRSGASLSRNGGFGRLGAVL